MTTGERIHVQHAIEPVYDANSEILILGTFPSVKSREGMFFYHHPQNRFWKVIAAITGTDPVPDTIVAKKEMLLNARIAVWDVIAECQIHGSDDASIQNVIPVDIEWLLERTRVRKICLNGTTAYRLYRRYLEAKTGLEGVCLPSTSPANAVWSLARLIEAWEKEISLIW